MNTALPSARATPRPSRSRDSTSATGTAIRLGKPTRAATRGPCPLVARVGPAGEEFPPVRSVELLDRRAGERDLAVVRRPVDRAAHALEAQEHEPGVEDVRLAVAPDVGEPTGAEGVPDLRAVHAELPREPGEPRELVERRARPRLVEREEIHQVDVPRVVAADVVVVPEVAAVGVVAVAQVPVARRGHAVDEAAVVEHRQVEPAAVPGDELRRVLLDAVVEALDELPLAVGGRAERPHPQRLALAQHAGDRDDALEVERQEVLPGRRAAALEDDLRHVRIGDRGVEPEDGAAARDVGHRLDVEDDRGRHPRAYAGKTPVER